MFGNNRFISFQNPYAVNISSFSIINPFYSDSNNFPSLCLSLLFSIFTHLKQNPSHFLNPKDLSSFFSEYEKLASYIFEIIGCKIRLRERDNDFFILTDNPVNPVYSYCLNLTKMSWVDFNSLREFATVKQNWEEGCWRRHFLIIENNSQKKFYSLEAAEKKEQGMFKSLIRTANLTYYFKTWRSPFVFYNCILQLKRKAYNVQDSINEMNEGSFYFEDRIIGSNTFNEIAFVMSPLITMIGRLRSRNSRFQLNIK